MKTKLRFTHLINPVHKPAGHELAIAQPVTFASIAAARRHYFDTAGGTVQLMCAGYEEDELLAPQDVDHMLLLKESFRDTSGRADAPKLPLARELLASALGVADGDYLIYTNIDIALMPHFYSAAAAYLENGAENLIINRRTIFPEPGELDHLDMLYSLPGNQHPGYDCFIFKAEAARRFELGDLSIGLPGFDWVLALNLWYRAGRNLGLYDHHLTFHIGDDKAWTSDAMKQWQRIHDLLMPAPLENLRAEFGDKEHFLWPRPSMPPNGLMHRAMNKIGRKLLQSWPSR